MKLKERILFINKDFFSIDIDTGLYTLINDHTTDTTEAKIPVVPEPLSSNPFGTGGETLGFRRFRKKFKTSAFSYKKIT